LCVTEPGGHPRDIPLIEERIKHDQQVEVNFSDIDHGNIRTIILRLAQCQTGS
jgi:hypothetical protein